MSTLLTEVAAERERQDAKWGPQSHEDAFWSLILQEEVGEVAEAALGASVFSGGQLRQVWRADPNYFDELRRELIQVAAVAVAWVEAIDRRSNGHR